MNFDDLYPTPYLKASELENGVGTFTIKSVARETLEIEGEQEDKVVMSFEEIQPRLVLAKVNAICIRQMFGKDVTGWIGKRVTFYGTTTIMPYAKRRDEPCIRVLGSPDIDDEVVCEWTPPKRKKLVQRLKCTCAYKISSKAIETTEPDALGAIEERIKELASQGQLTSDQLSELIAKIRSRR